MAKEDHWFKFYYKLILISCQGWKDDEFGAYVRLLINQFDRGGLPDDPAELSKLITSFKKNWPMLSKKFKKGEDGLLRNDFMDDIRNERDEKSKRFTEIGKSGGRPKKNQKDINKKPEGYENETYIYSYSPSSSNSLDDDRGVGKEETVLLSGGFFSSDLPKDMALTEIQVGATVQFISLKCKKEISAKDVVQQWEAFKIQQFGQHEWYKSIESLLNHFRNSLKQENFKNGKAKQHSSFSKTAGIGLAIDTALSQQNESGD